MLAELFDIVGRGLRLRCPCCGHGPLFRTLIRLHDACSACGERYEREPGQWFGAIYINIGLTLGITLAGFSITQAATSLSMSQQLAVWMPVGVAGPFALYRYSKGLWTSLVFHGEGLYIPWPPGR